MFKEKSSYTRRPFLSNLPMDMREDKKTKQVLEDKVLWGKRPMKIVVKLSIRVLIFSANSFIMHVLVLIV